MNRKTKKITLSLALVCAGGFVALNLVARNHVRAMLRFTNSGKRTEKPEALSFAQRVKVLLVGVNIPRPHGQATPADVGLEFKTVRIEGRDGIKLGAWYCPAVSNEPFVPNGSKIMSPTPYPSQEGIENKTWATNEFPSLEGTGVGSPFRLSSHAHGSASGGNLASLTLVLLFHGYSADKSSLLGEAAAFHALGFPVLLVDFRGSGESSASYTSIGFHEADDVTAAVLYAKSNLPQRKMILFGQSMGGVAILRAIHNRSIKPDAVIVEAVFDTMLNTVRHRFQAMGIPSFPGAQLLVFWGGRQIGFNGFKHNPVEYARSVACPILFLYGTDDPRARIDEGRRVYAATPAPKWFKEFPAAGHESYVSRYPQPWQDAVQEFVAIKDGPTADTALRADFHALADSAKGRTSSPLAETVADVADVGLLAKDRDRRSRLQKSHFQLDPAAPGTGDYVVLLHGLGRTTRSLRKMEKHLLREGFKVVNVAYPSNREPIETLASNYLTQAIATQRLQPDRKIHFITHSLGGIVLEYYLQHHALPNLGRVVMLCPPNQGSEVADRWRNNFLYRLFTGPAGQQLGTAPSSLPNRLGAVTFELGVIAGDRTLNPWTSQIIPGPDDGKVAVERAKVAGMKDFLVVHRTHTFIMRDRKVIDQAVFFINNGLFRRERT